MLFLTNERAKKAEKTFFAGTGITRPGLQAGACWAESKGYIRGGVARGSDLGL